jgi:hypothetical protein
MVEVEVKREDKKYACEPQIVWKLTLCFINFN